MSTLTARPMTADEAELFAAARLHAVHALMPYLATAVFRLQPWAVDGLGTFGVDASWRVVVDPATMAGWGVAGSAAVLLHEVGHALRDHAGVAERLGDELDRYAWNLCGDAAINDDLVACGIQLPARPWLPEDLRDRAGLPMVPGGTAWSYYEALPVRDVVVGAVVAAGASPGPPARVPGAVPPAAAADDEADPDGRTTPRVVRVPGRGVPSSSCGAVAGADPHDVALPPGVDGVSPAEQRLVRRAVAADIARTADGRGRGTVPAGLRRWAGEQLAPPAVPWQEQLRGAVRRGVAHVAGAVDTTYARPSRRRVPGVVLPGTRRPVPSVAVVVDTSASMDRGRLDAALAEVEGIARTVGSAGQRLRVVTVDAAVHARASVTSARQLALEGGGGTDLAPGLDAAVATNPVPDVVVVLTDGWTPWPAVSPRRASRWIVVLVDDGGAPPPPRWATTIRVGAVAA